MGRSFKDNADRTWAVAISIDTVRRVRDRLKVDLLNKKVAALLEHVLGDPILLCDVLFVIVQHDAEANSVTDVEFGRAMAGNALEEGAKAFLGALADFTPNPRDRERVGKAIEALLEAAEVCRDQADKAFPAAKKELIEKATSGAPFSSSPESQESNPGG